MRSRVTARDGSLRRVPSSIIVTLSLSSSVQKDPSSALSHLKINKLAITLAIRDVRFSKD